MSVQSTIHLNRKEAENLYVQQKLRELEEAFSLAAQHLQDGDLEEEIESTFTNYIIGEES